MPQQWAKDKVKLAEVAQRSCYFFLYINRNADV